MNIPGYPRVCRLGNKEILNIFDEVVVIQEKVDGSQLSMSNVDGALSLRSKGRQLDIEAPDKMFSTAIDVAKSLDLKDSWVYRGEYLSKPKHNLLCYDRVPKKHTILFDIRDNNGNYLSPDAVHDEASRLDMEAVPVFAIRKISCEDDFKEYLTRVSILGGQTVEGVVFKNYLHKHLLVGKYLSKDFEEVRASSGNKIPRVKVDAIDDIVQYLRTPARWNKAVQHLREEGKLKDGMEDIGPLMRELHDDLKAECSDIVKEMLFNWAWKGVVKGVSSGFPDWYRKKIEVNAFEDNHTPRNACAD